MVPSAERAGETGRPPLMRGARRELFAQRPGQVAHLVEVGGALLVDPAKQLGGAKALFAQPFAESGQALEIEVEQVGRHVMLMGRLRV
jgi:hypothetical protein